MMCTLLCGCGEKEDSQTIELTSGNFEKYYEIDVDWGSKISFARLIDFKIVSPINVKISHIREDYTVCPFCEWDIQLSADDENSWTLSKGNNHMYEKFYLNTEDIIIKEVSGTIELSKN